MDRDVTPGLAAVRRYLVRYIEKGSSDDAKGGACNVLGGMGFAVDVQ